MKKNINLNTKRGEKEKISLLTYMKFGLFLCLIFLLSSSALVSAWSNGGYSEDPSHPDYGTHDWIAQHALDWLPTEEKQYLLDSLATYLYGTELPDNGQAPDGIGDTSKHHVYFSSSGTLVDDSAAIRANATWTQALNYLLASNLTMAAKYAGIMSHYLADMAVFGHVMGDGTDWGTETHHSDYENYVNTRTSSYDAEFNVFLSFDGNLSLISAYNATILLAYDTTFDNGSLNCVWMDQHYDDWGNLTFRNRVGASLNLAVNYVTDVLHTLYIAYHGAVNDTTPPIANAGQSREVTVGSAVTFDANGSGDNVGITSYEWNFGDGATGTGATATHTYMSSGIYTVTVTVRDAAGNTDTDQITVTAREAFPMWIINAAVAAIGIIIATIILHRRR